MPQNLIMREIGVDMGHRVTNHGGKCRNLHGHRYRVQVFLSGECVGDSQRGQEQGMLMDFGFLKELMMREIDRPCDHGTCLWVDDPQFRHNWIMTRITFGGVPYEELSDLVAKVGYAEVVWEWGKLYVLSRVPTAENLARHWFQRLDGPVDDKVGHHGVGLHSVRVWETPNCYAEYIRA